LNNSNIFTNTLKWSRCNHIEQLKHEHKHIKVEQIQTSAADSNKWSRFNHIEQLKHKWKRFDIKVENIPHKSGAHPTQKWSTFETYEMRSQTY